MHGPVTPDGARGAGQPPSRPGTSAFEDDSLAAVARVLWRRKSTVVGVVALIVLLTAFVAFSLTPQYRAIAEVMLEPQSQRAGEGEIPALGVLRDGEAESQMRVMTSRALLEKVVTAEGLLSDPEFNAAIAPAGGLLAALGWRAEREREDVAPARQRAHTVDALSRNLSVRLLGRSHVMEVAVTSEDSEKAARLANAVVDAYIAGQLAAKRRANEEASHWLDGQVRTLREQVQAAERAVERYRSEAGLIGGRESGIHAQQMTELNSELILARARRVEVEARLRRAEELLAEGGADSAAEVLDSPLIQSLRQEEAAIQRREAELGTEYGDRHPRMINVRAELADLRGKIELEVRKIVQNLRNEARVAASREQALREALGAQETEAARLKEAEVRLRQLEREAEAERALFNTFLARLKETAVHYEVQRADARIISRAEPASRPASPNIPLILGLAFLAGLPCAAGLALLVDRRNEGISNLTELQAVDQAPALGMVHQLEPREAHRGVPADVVLAKPLSAYAEAFQGLRTRLLLSAVDRPPRSLMVTSAQPREGKSTLALGLARTLARGGHRVLLLEADFRNPALAGMLRLPERPGLAEVLTRQAPLERALQHDPHSSLHVLLAGTAADPTHLLSSRGLPLLLAACTRTYDMVIVDAPPVLVVHDPQVLAGMVDKTILAVGWRATSARVAAMALDRLRGAGADVAGTVLTGVDRLRHKHYGEGEEVAFGKEARAYYVE